MTSETPPRKRLKRHTQKTSKTSRKPKPQVTNWEPDPSKLTIKDLINAPKDMKGNYTGTIKRGNRKLPWELIATEYIEGIPKDPEDPESERSYPTLKELSDAYGIGIYQVKDRSKKDQWSKKRQQFQIVEAQRRMNSRKFTILGKSIEFDDNAHRAAEMGMKLIQVRLGEVAQEIKAKQQIRDLALANMINGQKYDRKDLYSAVNPREMESLAKAMSAFQEIGMKALGTDVIRHEISGIDTNVFIDQSTNNTQNNVSIQGEMQKDDPERLASILATLEDANLLKGVATNIIGIGQDDDEEVQDVIDAIPMITDGTENDGTENDDPEQKTA